MKTTRCSKRRTRVLPNSGQLYVSLVVPWSFFWPSIRVVCLDHVSYPMKHAHCMHVLELCLQRQENVRFKVRQFCHNILQYRGAWKPFKMRYRCSCVFLILMQITAQSLIAELAFILGEGCARVLHLTLPVRSGLRGEAFRKATPSLSVCYNEFHFNTFQIKGDFYSSAPLPITQTHFLN